MEWKDTGWNYILDNEESNFYISYLPAMPKYGLMESETALVPNDKNKEDTDHILIRKGDWRKELEALYPDWEACKRIIEKEHV